MIFRVVITDQALKYIEEQANYIAVEGQSPLNAKRWLSRVMAAAASLELMPRRNPRAPEAGHHDFEVRALNVDGFLLIFVVNDIDQTVRVITARHGRQLPNPEDLSNTMNN